MWGLLWLIFFKYHFQPFFSIELWISVVSVHATNMNSAQCTYNIHSFRERERGGGAPIYDDTAKSNVNTLKFAIALIIA